MLRSREFFGRVLKRFPPCDLVVAYGSGVMKQAGSSKTEQPMLDLIFAVPDAREWHKDNLALNRSDYAWPLSLFSGGMVANFQSIGGAQILYHPYVDAPDLEPNGSGPPLQLKYGVISANDLATDLRDWTTLFCSGRLHKPAVVLQQNPQFRRLLRFNLEAALHTAVLLLPPKFSERDLYVSIAGLSYTGDPRFTIGAESSSKVSDLVDGNFVGFRTLYQAAIDRSDWVERVPDTDRAWPSSNLTPRRDVDHVQQLFCRSEKWTATRADNEANGCSDILGCLPQNLRRNMADTHSQEDSGDRLSVRVTSALSRIVKRTMIVQNLKNVVAAGISNSFRYVLAKLRKGRESRNR